MRSAVFADIAGHLDDLIWHLEKLGCEFYDGTDPLLPSDLNVIFAGDLVHRGPKSAELIAFVDNLKKLYPRQVYMLLGNHEGNYFPQNPRTFSWGEHIGDEAAATLLRWWEKKEMTLSLAIDSYTGPLLITHAGLTRGFWEILDSPETPQEAHRALLGLQQDDSPLIWIAGEMLGDENKNPGPIWASSTRELYPSWLGADNVPFGQIHGHSAAYQWKNGCFFGASTINQEIPSRTVLLPNKRISITTIGGKAFFSCDPDHGYKPVDKYAWAPLVLEHSRILTK